MNKKIQQNFLKLLLIIPLIVSCSSVGKNELDNECLEEMNAFLKKYKNTEAVEAARDCNAFTYDKALQMLVQDDKAFFLSDEELDKVKAMNISSFSKKLDFEYNRREINVANRKHSSELHKKYVESDEYQKVKAKQDQQIRERRSQTYGTMPSSSSGSSQSSGYTQQTTDRYNSAVKSAADKEKQRVKSMENRRK